MEYYHKTFVHSLKFKTMKKFILCLFVALAVQSIKAQRYELGWAVQNFKRHYSCSVEGTFENGQVRQVIAGNYTDWLLHNQKIDGMLVTANLFYPQKEVYYANPQRYQLTDFYHLHRSKRC